jgi:pSer/pThr/pTyr-binding forkhead associated (FHA) protein
LINIGESYVVAYLISNQDEYDDSNTPASQKGQQHIPYKLKLKIFPPYNLENPDVVICQNEQQELVCGRSPNCDIRIDDQLISKMQSTIKYENGNWILEDGRDGKESTNGTWYYLN